MKLITAIIQPSKLDAVREALINAGISRITVNRVSGHGRQEGEELYRGSRVVPSLIPKTRLDIAVNDEFKDVTIKTILESAKNEGGTIGDGKIFVTNLEECIRIRTEEQGSEAI